MAIYISYCLKKVLETHSFTKVNNIYTFYLSFFILDQLAYIFRCINYHVYYWCKSMRKNSTDNFLHHFQFSGMYESDSNYRWRKVKGNLDLFVMERNERVSYVENCCWFLQF